MPTFQNALFNLHRQIGTKDPSYLSAYEDGTECSEDGTDSVPKCQHIKFRHRGITHKKAYNRSDLLLLD